MTLSDIVEAYRTTGNYHNFRVRLLAWIETASPEQLQILGQAIHEKNGVSIVITQL